MAAADEPGARRTPARRTGSRSTLDPRLDALARRLTAAIAQDSLVLDATVLGSDGQRVVDAMTAWLLTASLAMSGSVTVGTTADAVTLAAQQLESTVCGLTANAVTAVFGLADAGFSAQIAFDCSSGWVPTDSFPGLASTWAGTVVFVAEADDDAQLVLATDAGALVGSATQNVSVGLNLRGKLSATTGPATALARLASVTDGVVPVIGPARDDATVQQFTVTGSFPSFEVSLPILPTLSFQSPYAGVTAAQGPGLAAPTYAAALIVGADVGVGTQASTSLPLVVQLPTTTSGWRLGIAAGRTVPLPDLASFLGDFTGLGFVAALPTQVVALQKLALTNFDVQMTSALSGFRTMSLRIGSIAGSERENLWTIIPGSDGTPLLALSGIAFDLQVQNTTGGYVTSGSVQGVFNLSDTLQVSASVPIPAGSSPWIVTCVSTAALPNLTDFARYLGGEQLSGLLPRQLGEMTSYQLNALTFVYDPGRSELSRLALDIQSTATWALVTGWIEITAVRAQIAVDRPMTAARALTGTVSGAIAIAGAPALHVAVSRGAAGDPWYLYVTSEAIALPSLGAIADLCGGDITPLLPQTIVGNSFVLGDMALNVDVGAGKVRSFTFGLSTQDVWPLITDVLSITGAGIFLSLDWTTGTRQVAGSIWGNVLFCQASFWVEATKEVDGWVLAVTLAEDSQFTLQNLTKAFDAALWPTLQSLGVPDVALTTAAATYKTVDGSYDLIGAIAPADAAAWTIDVGITSLSVKRIGAEVTCMRAQDGTATDKKVHVRGSLAIGATQFDIDYLAGGNLTIDCTLVGSDPVPLSVMAQNLCGTATPGSWPAGFPAFADIALANAAARIVLGSAPQFQLSGQLLLGDVEVAAMFLVEKIGQKWEFALGIRLDTHWSLPGFTNAFSSFNIDTQTWTVVGSSFSQATFAFPPGFATPALAGLTKGLNFYGTIDTANTMPTIGGVTTVLPAGTLPGPHLTVHGLLTEPLASSYLEILLVADEAGVPLMGWDEVRLAQFALRLTATPSFALHGEFILRSIKNPDGTVLRVIMNLTVSLSGVAIVFERQPTQGAIFTWQDAFGLPLLDVALLDLALGIVFEGPAFNGTIGGRVAFEHRSDPSNSCRKNEPPARHIVRLMEAKRQVRALAAPDAYGQDIDYARAIDQDGILIEMRVSFIIPAEEPVPVPYMLAGRFINFTLPYVLKRFVNIDIPSLLMPITFPDVSFDFQLPNPLVAGAGQSLSFAFAGDIEIFGMLGHVDAQFSQDHIRFNAGMDPLTFSVGGYTIVGIARSATDATHGPLLLIDSAPPAGGSQISGSFYCNLFNQSLTFGGEVQLQIDPGDPAKSRFYFEFSGHFSTLAQLRLKLVYDRLNYMAVDGSFHLGLTTNNIPGFSKEGVQVADGVDLSKYDSGVGVVLDALLAIVLDATNPTAPHFTMHIAGGFSVNLGSGCDVRLYLDFDMDVDKDSLADIPAKIAHQLVTNTASIFGALLSSARCYAELLKIGIIVFDDALKVAKVFADLFETGIDLGASLLKDLGHTAESVAKALWDVFDSDDSESNTKALKDAGYDSDDTASAVKQAAGSSYQASDLVRDQAAAGYSAVQVLGGLCTAFDSYAAQPVAAGRLIADTSRTPFHAQQVAAGLRGQYANSTGTAQEMQALLTQIYAGASSLSAQQMADALAPLYPAAQVAQVLRNSYPDQTQTAAAMATLLVVAYTNAGAPLTAATLGGALAPFYPAAATAAVLRSDFAGDTDTALKLGTILKSAYAGTTTPLTAVTMAAALAASFTTPADVVPALVALYPADTDTAAKMAPLLIGAYSSMNVSQMAVALIAGGYPAQDVATALKTYFPTQAGTAVGLTRVMAAESYTPVQIAPVLKALFPADTGTAAATLDVLKQGFAPTVVTATVMIAALAAVPFAAAETAVALRPAYPADTATATQMASLLAAAYVGSHAIDAAGMASALAAAGYLAAGDAGTGAALLARYPAATVHALDLAKLLKPAPYPCSAIGPALKQLYPTETGHAADMAAILAQTPFDAPDAAPVLKTLYPAELATTGAMYTILIAAYPAATAQAMATALAASPYPIAQVAPTLHVQYAAQTATPADMYALLITAFSPAPGAPDMAGALAASPYAADLVGPLLKGSYPATAGTAAQLVGLLGAAYAQPAIDLPTMLGALVAAQFNAFEMVRAVKPAFTPLAATLGGALGTAMAAMPPSAAQLGAAFTTAAYATGDVAKGVLAGAPGTPAGLMAAVLLLASDTTMAPALAAAAGYKAAGDTPAVAAPKVVAAVSALPGSVLAVALDAVYGPPTPTLATLAGALPSAFAQPDAGAIATGLLVAFPATTAATLLTTLTTAFQAAGKPIAAAAAATAVAAAFQYVGSPLAQADYATMLVGAMGSAATPRAVAAAIVSAYAAAATPATIVPALVTGFADTQTLLDARVTVVAVQQALQLASTQAAAVAGPVGAAFQLTRCPNDVGVLAVALKAGGFTLNATSAALAAYLGSTWNAQGFAVVGSVYAKPMWATALSQREAGAGASAAAVAVYAANAPNAADMVQVLAGTYDLNVTAPAIAPMTAALKGVVAAGAKVYSLNAASAAMSAQYSPDWTAADWGKFASIYNS